MIPPSIESKVQIILKESHLSFLANTKGIKTMSEGIGIIIDSKNENNPRNLTEFLFKNIIMEDEIDNEVEENLIENTEEENIGY